ncbi:MAG: hypothetical protein K2Y23_12215 [Cyanobacteria bacterium]|nr:hypothetical protein [Cyanobacteriota bacterium]
MLPEVAKIAVAGHQRHTVIDTALGNEAIGEARLDRPLQQRAAQFAAPLPVTIASLEPGQGLEEARNVRAQLRCAEQLRKDDRRKARVLLVVTPPSVPD